MRFELKPVGTTLGNIQKNGIIEKDTALAASYKEMKNTIDEFHKDFIERTLSNASLSHLKEYYDILSEDKTEKNDKLLASAKQSLRKEYVKRGMAR